MNKVANTLHEQLYRSLFSSLRVTTCNHLENVDHETKFNYKVLLPNFVGLFGENFISKHKLQGIEITITSDQTIDELKQILCNINIDLFKSDFRYPM